MKRFSPSTVNADGVTRTPCPQNLTGYLAGTLGVTALLSASQADAAVTAVTFGFGSVFDQSDGSSNFAVGSYGNIRGHVTSSTLYLGYSPRSSVGNGFVYNNGSRAGQGGKGVVSFFANGTVIGDGSTGTTSYTGTNGTRGYAYFQSNDSLLNLTGDQTNQNIAFRTGTGNWGWANVSWNNTAKALTVNSAYVESVAGHSITVGDVGAVPEPSRALLALAGLGGVAMRRRRKRMA